MMVECIYACGGFVANQKIQPHDYETELKLKLVADRQSEEIVNQYWELYQRIAS